MAGMYPENQALTIFGEQVQWPGVGADGKFHNGDFNDPQSPPCYVPAESINLILDNLSAFITKCGGTPNSVSPSQLADLVTHLAQAGKLVLRDAHGRAKIGLRPDTVEAAEDDIATIADLLEIVGTTRTADTPFGYGHVTDGRNLLNVLDAGTVAEAMETLHTKINADGVPDFSGLQVGDYLDLPSLNDGSATYTWDANYKNLRIVIAGLNTYKGMGGTENTKNHIVFVFENCPLTKRMNSSNTNTGGYAASELKTYLEGGFLTGLIGALGHDYMYQVRRYISTKSGYSELAASIFPPTELEVYGMQLQGDEIIASSNFINPIQLPLYRDSYTHRIKRYNGSRQWWWLSTPYSGSSPSFCSVSYSGHVGY